MERELRCTADDFHGLSRIGDTWKLDDNSAVTGHGEARL